VSSPYDDRLDKVDPGATLPGPTANNRNPSGDPNVTSTTPSSGQAGTAGKPGSRTISAPTSPLKDIEPNFPSRRTNFLGKVSSLSQAVSAKAAEAKDKAESYRAGNINKERCFTLLVIDDQNTDWSKYFRGKRVHTDWDIRVEQAEFKELQVTASSETGVSVLFQSARPFKPDIVLVRQNILDVGQDFKNILLALQYGGLSSVNSLQSIYNFQDKPWVFGQLLQIQRRLGKEKFPLINQMFYSSYKEMVDKCKLPCVLKIGHAHGGRGKIKVETAENFQDLVSVVAVSGTYCSVEDYVDAKYDLHIFKIGDKYRAIMRKSLVGNWKTSLGQCILEEVPVQEKYRIWIDEVSVMFGGLSICSLEMVVDKEGKEFIIEVNDCSMRLIGESQEEDRRNISDLVIKQMETECQPPKSDPAITSRPESAMSGTSESGKGKPDNKTASGEPDGGGRVRHVSKTQSNSEVSGVTKPIVTPTKEDDTKKEKPPPPPPPRRSHSEDSSDSESSTESASTNSPTSVRKMNMDSKGGVKNKEDPENELAEGEDTMKNLRTTFAGIFGDIK